MPEWTINEWANEWTTPGWINTNGPYVLASWAQDEHLQLVKNPLWPNADQVQIDVVDQPIVVDSDTTLAMYQNQEIDTMYAASAKMDDIRADDNLSRELVVYPELCTYYYGFVHTKPPFDDVRVRQAFSAAIDRQFVVDEVTRGGEIPATTFAPPGVFGAPAPGSLGQNHDPDLARKSLQAFLAERGL
ncbi:ABC transporter substrate-binding protein, partial [Chloroflexota bacterium]